MNPERFMVNEAEQAGRIRRERIVIEGEIKQRIRNLHDLGLSSDKVSEILTYLHLNVVKEFSNLH